MSHRETCKLLPDPLVRFFIHQSYFIWLCLTYPLRIGFPGEVSGENVSANTGPRSGDRGEAADLGTHTENNDGTTLAANTAVDARGGSPQGAHLSGAATPRPPRGRRRQNQNGLDTTQVSGTVFSVETAVFSLLYIYVCISTSTRAAM